MRAHTASLPALGAAKGHAKCFCVYIEPEALLINKLVTCSAQQLATSMSWGPARASEQQLLLRLAPQCARFAPTGVSAMATSKGIYTPCAGRQPAASEQPTTRQGSRATESIQESKAQGHARTNERAAARPCRASQLRQQAAQIHEYSGGRGPSHRVVAPAAARVRRPEGPGVRVRRQKATWCSCSPPCLLPRMQLDSAAHTSFLTRASEHGELVPSPTHA